ncbi:hypothetical protein LINPERPRIM_LOCUS4828 [Linum perenne]
MAMQEDATANPRCPRIAFSEAEIKGFYKPWSKALVVKILERSFSFPTVKRRLEFLWAKVGRIQVSDMANSFFLVRFSDNVDYRRAAFDGPWKLYDYYISVSRWSPLFNENEPIQKLLTWVRLPRLPIHYFNHLAVSRIGNYIGKTVRLDLATAEGARARYARVCVEIDLTKPLLGKYIIEDREFHIEYECLDNICFSCGFYGHKEICCPDKVLAQPESQVPESKQEVEFSKEGDAGSWMTVCRRNNKRNPKNAAQSKTDTNFGSRFDILTEISPTQPPDGGKATESPSKESVGKISPEAEAYQVVLEKGMNSDPQKVPNFNNSEAGNTPLKDITNHPKTKKTARGSTSKDSSMIFANIPPSGQKADKLVNVPISYHNPVFQVDPAPSNEFRADPERRKSMQIKPKAAKTARKGTVSVKPAVAKSTKRFSPKLPDSEVTLTTPTDEQKIGKPPDTLGH